MTHYVDNVEFHSALVSRKALVDFARENNQPIPRVNNQLGVIFLKMATNIAYKHNFNRYPFKEEMIGDGIIDCLKYIDTFDATRNNPFAYFTQAISMAFIRRIIKEKKQGYVKSLLLSKSTISLHELQEHDELDEFVNAFKEYMEAYNNFDGSMFEKKKKIKQFIYKGSTLEDFCG